MGWFRKEQPRNLEQELLEARAKLARYKKLPESDFTIYPSILGGSQIITHGVDRKEVEIARIEADIAELEVLTGARNAQAR